MRRAAAFCAAILGLAVLSSASAQSVAPTLVPKPAPAVAPKLDIAPTTIATQATPQLTAQDTNAWLDGYMPIAIGRAVNARGADVDHALH